jgi:hypothetical protein
LVRCQDPLAASSAVPKTPMMPMLATKWKG